ncbi:MAG: SMI1/KNR4 family protein [Oscillospiraceae bacterium]
MENQINRIKSKLENKDIKLNQPLPIEKIINFENEYNIKLPKELVAFYTQISNGCTLDPRESIENLYPFEDWLFNKEDIKKDFPIENELLYDDFETLKKQGSNWDFLRYGNICLMDLGCACGFCITVKGKHYGEIWADFEEWLPFTNKNFLDWFELWLENRDALIFFPEY